MSNEQKRQELLAQGYVKVGSKTYLEYWKKGDDVITLITDKEIEMKQVLVVWYDIKDCQPKNMSRVLVDIRGHTQSNILIYINGIWYRDDVCERVEYSISNLISRWCYLPLSNKDAI